MRRGAELRSFADRHELPVVSIADLAAYRWQHERLVTQVASTRLPTELGVFRGYGYRSAVDGSEHLALVHGDLGDGREILTRLHSECLKGDVFGSCRCDCGSQLEASMAAITAAGAGVVVYLRGHEGRGIGLLHKLQAYALQDSGRDTVDANLDLGLPADARHYGTGAQILRHLGVRSVLLLSNNPAKAQALQRLGVGVTERRPLTTSPTPDNLRYLRTKAARLGHDLPALQDLLGGPGTVPAGEPL
ncbi:MAG: GTP cyclohydrolase II [Nocardioidaceae bacterium]